MDDCKVAVLGDAQLSGRVMLRYWTVCHDVVMNLGNGLLCGNGDWPSRTGEEFFCFPKPHIHCTQPMLYLLGPN